MPAHEGHCLVLPESTGLPGRWGARDQGCGPVGCLPMVSAGLGGAFPGRPRVPMGTHTCRLCHALCGLRQRRAATARRVLLGGTCAGPGCDRFIGGASNVSPAVCL